MGIKNKMQQKFQTILFFTFLICAQISITNSLKIKSKINSRSKITKNATTVPAANTTTPVPAPKATVPAPAAPATAPTATAPLTRTELERKRNTHDKHHHHSDIVSTDVSTFAKTDIDNPNTDDHLQQYNVHHVVPKNLTSLNDKVRERFTLAHKRLDEINDLKKEEQERKVIAKLPTKPFGIDSIGILNFKLRHISKHSQNFNITSVSDFEYAFNKARYFKKRESTVNGKTYKIKQIGTNFWYGAIVGNGGIGLYSHKDYLLVVVHNQNMSLFDFARYFEKLKHDFENNQDKLRVVYIKDHNQEREDAMKDRLKADKHLYDKTH